MYKYTGQIVESCKSTRVKYLTRAFVHGSNMWLVYVDLCAGNGGVAWVLWLVWWCCCWCMCITFGVYMRWYIGVCVYCMYLLLIMCCYDWRDVCRGGLCSVLVYGLLCWLAWSRGGYRGCPLA